MWLKVKFLTCAVLFSLFRTSFGVEQGSSDVRVFVKEGSDVVLPCSPGNKDLNYVRFEWDKVDPNGQKEVFVADGGIHSNDGSPSGQDPQFKGRVSHFKDELQLGNASIKINNTKLEDSGNYRCHFPKLDQTFRVQLVVDGILKDRSGSPGVAPAPGIKIVKATNNWWQLQCDVRGASPKPKVEWKNSDGEVLHSQDPQVTESKGRYDVTLLTTVNQTGHYNCVVTQEELHHQIHSETNVSISGGKTSASENPGWGWLILAFVLGVVVAVVATLWIQRWLRGSNVKVLGEKGRDVILPCFLEGEDLTMKVSIWKKRDQKGNQTVFFYNDCHTVTSTFLGQHPQFKGRVSHFRDELQHGIAAIKIQNTTVEDSGIYKCHFPGLKKTFCVELVVVEPNDRLLSSSTCQV